MARRLLRALALLAAGSAPWLAPGPAAAKVSIVVDLGAQTLDVSGGGVDWHWRVSSGRFGHETPNGSYNVLWMDKDHRSKTYDDAPMPWAIFFKSGYAIHGAYKSNWGRPASHGCVRLPVEKAHMLFDLVQREGARISIVGEPDFSRAPEVRQARSRPYGGGGDRGWGGDRGYGAYGAYDAGYDGDDVPTGRFSPRSVERFAPREEPYWPE